MTKDKDDQLELTEESLQLLLHEMIDNITFFAKEIRRLRLLAIKFPKLKTDCERGAEQCRKLIESAKQFVIKSMEQE